MDKYADEVRYRPRPVIALVGMPDVQATLVSHLSTEDPSRFASPPHHTSSSSFSSARPPPSSGCRSSSTPSPADVATSSPSESASCTADELSTRPEGDVALPVREDTASSLSDGCEGTRARFQMTRFSYGGNTPRRKDKRTTYEGYTPAGMLKLSWLHRHVTSFPSVLTVFISWEDEVENWQNKEIETLAFIDQARQIILTKNIRLLVVLVVNDIDDIKPAIREQKVHNVAKHCNLSERNFVFFSRKTPKDCTVNVEKHLMELASQYYMEEAKRLKKQKDLISKRSQPQLLVRLYFKIGFLYEFCTGFTLAIKYYRTAYVYLREVLRERRTYAQLIEVKAVADMLNFKICKLLLTENGIQEACTQFQKHVNTWQDMIGTPHREYEHWDWLSSQFEVFGDLMACANPASPNATPGVLHAGYYYQAAASYTQERRKQAKRIYDEMSRVQTYSKILLECKKNGSSTAFLQPSDVYFGQRTVRSPVEVEHPLEDVQDQLPIAGNEMADHARVLSLEIQYDYSQRVIRLLEQTFVQYSPSKDTDLYVALEKSEKNTRLLLYVLSQIADEHFRSARHDIAQRHYKRIESTYIAEQWYSLSCAILNKLMECAIQLKHTAEYVWTCVRALEPGVTTSATQRRKHQEMIASVLSPLRNQSGLPTLEENVVVQLHAPLLEIGARFSESTVAAGREVTLLVRMVSHFPLAMRFSDLVIEFNDTSYNVNLSDGKPFVCLPFEEVSSESVDDESSMLLLPDIAKVYRKTFTCKAKGTLTVTSLLTRIGAYSAGITLLLPTISADLVAEDGVLEPETVPETTKFVARPTLRILDREPTVELEVQHTPPALVNEQYHLQVTIKNGPENLLDCSLLLDVQNFPAEKVFFSEVGESGECTTVEKLIQVGALKANEVKKLDLFSRCRYISPDRILLFSLLYKTDAFETRAVHSVASPVCEPLECEWTAFSTKFQAIATQSGSIRCNDPFLLRLQVKCKTASPIGLLSSEFQVDDEKRCEVISSTVKRLDDGSFTDVLETVHMGDTYTFWFKLKPLQVGESLNMGVVNIRWRRADGELTFTPEVNSTFPVPPILVTSSPFLVSVITPSEGSVGCMLSLEIHIQNLSYMLEDLSVLVKENDSFVFAGVKRASFKVCPAEEYVLRYNLLPISAGQVRFPKFIVKSKRYGNDIVDPKQPDSIWIRPAHQRLSSCQTVRTVGV
eukprot:CAMPEP_0174242618 /NCGR_PEP_ID=MMETSP0417-20130205/28537_1 /TAXON_ID=242541 /ORGANISM="Mayorella sp, Strain BSH-02190019" /LENGTH=1199 /DNA_ID=CAMNT_0015322037 /DNA_START=109 /DNA_END=3708 /DNA_ORIENTATION=+